MLPASYRAAEVLAHYLHMRVRSSVTRNRCSSKACGCRQLGAPACSGLWRTGPRRPRLSRCWLMPRWAACEPGCQHNADAASPASEHPEPAVLPAVPAGGTCTRGKPSISILAPGTWLCTNGNDPKPVPSAASAKLCTMQPARHFRPCCGVPAVGNAMYTQAINSLTCRLMLQCSASPPSNHHHSPAAVAAVQHPTRAQTGWHGAVPGPRPT